MDLLLSKLTTINPPSWDLNYSDTEVNEEGVFYSTDDVEDSLTANEALLEENVYVSVSPEELFAEVEQELEQDDAASGIDPAT